MTVKEKLLRILFPEVCPVCGEILTEENRYEKNPFICRSCYRKTDFMPGPRCLKCAKPIEDETQPLCRECARGERFFDRGFALFAHDEAAKHIIYGFKFRCELDNIRFPALETALRYGPDLLRLDIDAFVPVPLHKSRLRERGYNQAQLIADQISGYMRILYGHTVPCDGTYLLRNVKTKYQKDLDHKYRQENVKDAFCINPDSDASYKRVCIVDDIYTTGSTIGSCAKVLKRSGCENVYFVALSTVGNAEIL